MKSNHILKIVISVLFLIFVPLLLVMTIKPGAAIFFVKKPLLADQVEYKDGLIVTPIELSESKFNIDTLLVRRTDQLLPEIKTEELPERQEPAYAVERKSEGQFVIRIVSELNQLDDDTLGEFQILVRPRFITQFWFKFLGFSLGIGLLLSIISIIAEPGNFRSVLTGKWGGLGLWDRKIPYFLLLRDKSKLLVKAISKAVIISFFYVLMEWIFFVTKPSFMDLMTLGQKISVLFITGLIVSLIITVLTIIIFCLDAVFSSFQTTFTDFLYYIPAALLAVGSTLLLFDNFTYTVFHFGISTITSWVRIVYLIGLVVAFFLILRFLSKREIHSKDARAGQGALIGAGVIILISLVIIFVNFKPLDNGAVKDFSDQNYRTPNIILLSDDGLNAENMSLYGYERETTPFLESLSSTSLLMHNNFTNANQSTGSDTAMLTGKSPFTTRVLFPPNILEGTDTLEHLPNILKKIGYRNISLSLPYWLDMGVINFQNGFDGINGSESNPSGLVNFASSYGYNDAAYFFVTIAERIQTRVFHILHIEEMQNPYLLVTEPSPTQVYMNLNDTYENLTESLIQADLSGQPLFAHIHMGSTHGPKFFPEERVFSDGKEQNNSWMTDFYDDAILEYDGWVADFVDFLKTNNIYEDTIIIFYTDHAEQWSVQRKIPLMIHFPGDEHAGEIIANTQNLDIAPTILDYIGFAKPQWMMGQSLLGDISRTRYIYSAEVDQEVVEHAAINERMTEPPFYQFGYLDVIQCQYLYEIKLKTGHMTRKEIPAYVDPCEEDTLDSPEKIWNSATSFLLANGFDIPEGWEKPLDYSTE
ncbi:sulfatase-like hydrolase/transferase [bacterium]|nr:sulfatase-like hydrolase/transferase [bacterium]